MADLVTPNIVPNPVTPLGWDGEDYHANESDEDGILTVHALPGNIVSKFTWHSFGADLPLPRLGYTSYWGFSAVDCWVTGLWFHADDNVNNVGNINLRPYWRNAAAGVVVIDLTQAMTRNTNFLVDAVMTQGQRVLGAGPMMYDVANFRTSFVHVYNPPIYLKGSGELALQMSGSAAVGSTVATSLGVYVYRYEMTAP